MKLVVDIGNTSVTCGLFKANLIFKKFHIQSINEFKKFIDNQLLFDLEKIIISSVVPNLTMEYSDFFKKNYNKEKK